MVQVYRKKWVIHIERATKDKKNGAQMGAAKALCSIQRPCHLSSLV